jgi:hypothetical protein
MAIGKAVAIIVVLVVIAVAGVLVYFGGSFLNPGSTTLITQTFATSDYAFFIQPNLARIELVREWFMSPFDLATNKAGYDPSYDLIRGGFWSGGFQNGFVLIDTNLIVANTLDYLNAKKGITSNITGSLAGWLTNTTFIDPSNNQIAVYNGQDRREIMFGTELPCVMEDSGQTFYAPGHTLSDPVPITAAIPTGCATTQPQSMNVYALWIELYYLEGKVSQAKQMFYNTINSWTSTPGTGINGTTGGYFSDTYDSGPDQGKCHSSRTLGYWLDMVRATGFWDLSQQTREISLQAMDELWNHQQSNGGIMVNYPGCGSPDKDSGESSGLTLAAFDPRLPAWFGQSNSSVTASSTVSYSSSSIGVVSELVQSLLVSSQFIDAKRGQKIM